MHDIELHYMYLHWMRKMTEEFFSWHCHCLFLDYYAMSLIMVKFSVYCLKDFRRVQMSNMNLNLFNDPELFRLLGSLPSDCSCKPTSKASLSFDELLDKHARY